MASLSLALSEGAARAAPLTVRLEYAAGAGCPDAADFKDAVIARLGYDPFVDNAPARVLVRVEPRGAAVDGRIEWRDASDNWTGEQTFPAVSTDCPRLARTMGFALAVQIQLLARAQADPDANAAAPPPAGSPPAPPPAPAAAKPTIPVQPLLGSPERSPSGPRRAVIVMGVGPSVGLGMSSSPVALARLFGALAWPHVSIELAAVASLPATTRRPDGAGFSQQHLLGSAAACATAVRWSACLVASAGQVRMAGEDIDRPTTASVPLAQAGARIGIRQDLGPRVFVNARGEAMVNLVRWTARLDQVPVWTAPRFGGAIGLDVGVRFR